MHFVLSPSLSETVSGFRIGTRFALTPNRHDFKRSELCPNGRYVTVLLLYRPERYRNEPEEFKREVATGVNGSRHFLWHGSTDCSAKEWSRVN
jgi:hypothetical protein